ncbi:MAG: MCE family protein [Caulobacteraceae bacterium]|nr:MCE family protein [Caulobacteraceae bacterium]
MTETPSAPPRLSAREIRSRWPGLVWAVPIAALLVVLYLAINALAHTGVDAVVVFGSGSGAIPGDTKVIYRGVQVGHVVSVGLDKDGHSVDVKIRIEGGLKRQLNTSTVFWVEGANFSLTDLSSIKAAVAGVTIDMASGTGGQPQRRFIGLDSPPAVLPDAKGTAFWLQTDNLGAVQKGSNIIYQGMQVGKVAEVEVRGANDLRAELFVFKPYDQLVRPGSLFWSESALKISLSGGGVSAGFNPAAALGAVSFETPEEFRGQAPAPAGTKFALYANQDRAFGEGVGPQVYYTIDFPQAVGDVALGAPVMLHGFQVGAVKAVDLAVDPATGRIAAPVTISIEPIRLHLQGMTPPAAGNWRPIVDRTLDALVARGYRARLDQSPPLIGSRHVSLDPIAGAKPAHLMRVGEYPVVPSAPSADIGALGDKANTLLDHLNAVPLEEIGENARQITGRLAQILKSPKIDDAVSKLDDTLDQADKMVREVRPQVGPLITSLRHAADQLDATVASANSVLGGQGASQDASVPDALRQLSDAARSIRALADYLQRHPEAIVQGKK